MKPKLIPKNWQTWLWFAVLGLTLSYCTAEGCEDCEEPLPTEILSFTYMPNPVFVGDTVTFNVQIKDSLETGFEYYWYATDGGNIINIGNFLNGTIDRELFGPDDKRNVYKTIDPINKWIASDSARIAIVIENERKSKRRSSTSTYINPKIR
jgi:hypothetical protein